ncbi:MAG: YjbQ family protein [Anaerolineae bacterium]|nr:YjbQ family protein [Anaerolineae bacterium]
MTTVTVKTTQKAEIVNVTGLVASLVSGIEHGIVLVSLPHTSAALIVCEDDAELREDIIRAAQEMFAPLRPFRHIRNNNPNAEAHLISAFAGTSLTLGVANGGLQLGTYQNLLLLELDGPKTRELQCVIVPGKQP